MRRLTGGEAVLLGVSAAAACLAVLFAGARMLNVAFAPFATIDWLTRVVPGAVATRTIDAMVSGLRMLSVDDLSSAAKAAEMMSGVVGVGVLLAIAGAVFAWLAPIRRAPAIASGASLGAVLGALLASLAGAVSTPAAPVAGAWTVLVLVLWGAALGWLTGAAVRRRVESKEAVPQETGDVNRRRFLLEVGGASAILTIAGTVAGRAAGARRNGSLTYSRPTWSSAHALPNAGAAVAPAPGTRAELTAIEDHYRIDIDTIPPAVDGAAWRLRIGGLVKRPMSLSLDDLRHRKVLHQFITLSCISNPVGGSLIGTTRWSGVPLGDLLDELELEASASHLRIRSADGFHEVVAIDLVRADRRVMLAYEWDGIPLTAAHGFPLRLYVPDLYGMKQPKWIDTIEAIDAWEPGYWVQRGWDREARMKATSVIDTIGNARAAGSNGHMPIGGIAHAGARGISAVEVRIDEGLWMPARLRNPLSDTTWVLWRYDWPSQPGRHVIAVRCLDGDGRAQIEASAPPHPDGASGLHTRTISV